MKTSFFKQVLLLLIMCSISCTPVDGEMGPQGPAGENGKDGNVNIISSGWITNPAFGNKGLGTSFPISDKKPYFNEDLRDNGLVMVYGKLKNSNYVKALATVILRRMIYSFDISD